MLGEGRERLRGGTESRAKDPGPNGGSEEIHSQVVWPISCDFRGDWGRSIENYYHIYKM